MKQDLELQFDKDELDNGPKYSLVNKKKLKENQQRKAAGRADENESDTIVLSAEEFDEINAEIQASGDIGIALSRFLRSHKEYSQSSLVNDWLTK